MLYYQIRQKNQIIFFGHRGAPKIRHENTISSICKSIELGCHGVEIDIQKTKDNKIILFHDDFIISNSKKYFINQLEYQHISQLCQFNNIPQPDPIEDLVNIIKNHPKIIFNIEIKSKSLNNRKTLNYILKHIPQRILLHQCIISSFNYFLLCQLRHTFFYKGKTALILDNTPFNNQLVLQIKKTFILILNPDFLHINFKQTTGSFINWAHKKSIFINTYTINDKTSLERCISLGVDGVFTDNHQLYNK